MIPKIIHFVWIGNRLLPDWAERNIAEFSLLNPGFDIMVHGPEVLFDEFKKHFNNALTICQKADLLRLCALKRFGGFYFDVDFFPFRSLDDLINAYDLDGVRMFVSKMQGNHNPMNTHGNAPLACRADCEALDWLLDEVRAVPKPATPLDWGPRIIIKGCNLQAQNFIQAEPQWFFPLNPNEAGPELDRLLNGNYNESILSMCPGTTGQKPFALHLWAGGKTEICPGKSYAALSFGHSDNKLVGIAAHPLQMLSIQKQQAKPISAVCDGLINAGYRVEVVPLDRWPAFSAKPKAMFIWNGMAEHYKHITAKAVGDGIPVFRIEHGFYDRMVYSQIDSQGILHWSSWAKDTASPCPAWGAERFRQVHRDPIKQITPRNSGYVLALGQCVNDTQLIDSEIKSGLKLEKIVWGGLHGSGVKAMFRPHPLDHTEGKHAGRLPRCPANTLEEAIAGARFVVTVNSNAAVQALAMGCPVMCFGPSIGIAAKAVYPTTMQTIVAGFKTLCDGWVPEQDAVENYLYWLACRQWSFGEISEGTILKNLIERSGEIFSSSEAVAGGPVCSGAIPAALLA